MQQFSNDATSAVAEATIAATNLQMLIATMNTTAARVEKRVAAVSDELDDQLDKAAAMLESISDEMASDLRVRLDDQLDEATTVLENLCSDAAQTVQDSVQAGKIKIGNAKASATATITAHAASLTDALRAEYMDLFAHLNGHAITTTELVDATLKRASTNMEEF